MQTIAPELAELAGLIADPGRASILSRLMDGRPQTASELALVAGVTPQTASWHLSRMVERALLKVERRGPRRFYRLATPLVAQMLEGMMAVAAIDPHPSRPPPRIDPEMRRARTCYDHLAGELGVAVTDAMRDRGHLNLDHEAGELTACGRAFSAISASTCVRRRGAGGSCAGPVSTGASGVRIWPGGRGLRLPTLHCNGTGSGAGRRAAPSKSPTPDSSHSEICSARAFDFGAEFGYRLWRGYAQGQRRKRRRGSGARGGRQRAAA
ncbi:ArsR/SmtB family transcription factor [Bradyrhizobium sp. BR 1433]|uniref:ArsR/SmtB family transcription factor n=1 Tax=Bradyrhizobium sp. BR 1433 TaxID=3447967 RepID=UPI003EE5E105